jgi:hypothetical protein
MVRLVGWVADEPINVGMFSPVSSRARAAFGPELVVRYRAHLPSGASFMVDLQDRAKASIVVVRPRAALYAPGASTRPSHAEHRFARSLSGRANLTRQYDIGLHYLGVTFMPLLVQIRHSVNRNAPV